MMHPSTKKLVDRLHAMTTQGKIEWAEGEDAGSLVYDTEGYRVVLSGSPTNVLLTDNNGNELERVDADELLQTPHADGGTYDAIVASLATEAQRIARGTETAISSVLEGLDLDGDGVVDIPMEDGLVPTPAEIADPQPDTVEDTADESGAAALADADVNDMSKAVASLADQVNENEEQRLSDTSTDQDPLENEVQHEPDQEPEPSTGRGAAIAGFGAAGLGAASLLKAASDQTTQSIEVTETTEPDPAVETASLETTLPQMGDIATPQSENFDLKAAEPAEQEGAPLKLDTQQPSEAEPTAPAEPAATEAGFVPPRPGEVLSLSGLTKSADKDKPVMAGTATTMTGFGAINNEAATPTENADAPIEPAPAAPPPPMPEPVVPEEATAAPEPETAPAAEPTPETEAEAETEAEEKPAPVSSSRFNPWI